MARLDLHRVSRITRVLLLSELRSGRSLADPKSLFGRPAILALLDAAIFAGTFLFAFLALRSLGPSLPSQLLQLAVQLVVIVPLLALGVVLVAGIMFEFSTGSRFSTSDAVNWLPVTPSEYVAASSLAVAFVYSPSVAFVLGATGGLAVALGLLPTFLLSAGLSVVALFEGGTLIEVLRATTQRAAAALSGRRGRVALVLRALLFLLVFLLLELSFNPVLFLGLLGVISGVTSAATFVPFLWSTQALIYSLVGNLPAAAAFVVGELAFAGFLLYVAAQVRVRLWSPAPAEVRLEAHAFGRGHGTLARFGLSGPESSLLWKDLVGLVRRREMLPLVVTPLVLALVGFLQAGSTPDGAGAGTLTNWWGPFVSGFFALMISTTCLGQERRSIQTLFAYPLSARSLFRAKVTECLLLSSILGIGLDAAIVGLYRPPAAAEGYLFLTTLAAILVGTFLGLAVATRFSDFQERPRSQFVRPWAMIVSMLGGVGLIFGMVIPGLTWVYASSPSAPGALAQGGFSVGLALVTIPFLFVLARRGADRFLDELPT